MNQPILYVETNWLCHLYLRQEHSEFCQELQQLARDGKLSVCVPVASILEAQYNLVGRHKERGNIGDEVRAIINQLRRGTPSAEQEQQVERLAAVPEVLAAINLSEGEELDKAVENLRPEKSNLTLLPLAYDLILEAMSLRLRLGLETTDAIILASIAAHAEENPQAEKAFFTLDSDFAQPEIFECLKELGIALLTHPDKCRAYVERFIEG